MASSKTIPTEDQEQIEFVQWLDINDIPHWHTNNEMWTKSWKQKMRSKRMGTKSGIPDLFLCFDGKLIGIEMKRQKGGVVSDNQKYWGYILENAGVHCFVCRGCDHAIETVVSLMHDGSVNKMPLKTIENAKKYLKMDEKPLKKVDKEKNDSPF